MSRPRPRPAVAAVQVPAEESHHSGSHLAHRRHRRRHVATQRPIHPPHSPRAGDTLWSSHHNRGHAPGNVRTHLQGERPRLRPRRPQTSTGVRKARGTGGWGARGGVQGRIGAASSTSRSGARRRRPVSARARLHSPSQSDTTISGGDGTSVDAPRTDGALDEAVIDVDDGASSFSSGGSTVHLTDDAGAHRSTPLNVWGDGAPAHNAVHVERSSGRYRRRPATATDHRHRGGAHARRTPRSARDGSPEPGPPTPRESELARLRRENFMLRAQASALKSRLRDREVTPPDHGSMAEVASLLNRAEAAHRESYQFRLLDKQKLASDAKYLYGLLQKAKAHALAQERTISNLKDQLRDVTAVKDQVRPQCCCRVVQHRL